jgi:predicted amidophosphoribosyltransferase
VQPPGLPEADPNVTVIMERRRPSEQVVVSPAPSSPAAPARTCARCGTQQTHAQAFCINCGSPLASTAAPEPAGRAPCPACGAVVDQTRRFCTSCGTPFAR